MFDSLQSRRIIKNVYLLLVFLLFYSLVFLIDLKDNNHGFVKPTLGFVGGTILAYLVFVLRHRLPIWGDVNLEGFDWLPALCCLILAILFAVGVVWQLALGRDSEFLIGVILSFYGFEITVGSWWDKVQEQEIHKKIESEILSAHKKQTFQDSFSFSDGSRCR